MKNDKKHTTPTSTEGPDGIHCLHCHTDIPYAGFASHAIKCREIRATSPCVRACTTSPLFDPALEVEETKKLVDRAVKSAEENGYHVHGHSEHKTWETAIKRAAEEFARQSYLYTEESETYSARQKALDDLVSQVSFPLAHAKEEGDFKNGICMHCDRCGRKKVPLGRVLEYGKFYPSVTRKFADGHTEETPATNEIRKAPCIPCSKETWSNFEATRVAAQRETVEAAIKLIEENGFLKAMRGASDVNIEQLDLTINSITSLLRRSLAPTPEQPPKEV